jgi:hypothetical protein
MLPSLDCHSEWKASSMMPRSLRGLRRSLVSRAGSVPLVNSRVGLAHSPSSGVGSIQVVASVGVSTLLVGWGMVSGQAVISGRDSSRLVSLALGTTRVPRVVTLVTNCFLMVVRRILMRRVRVQRVSRATKSWQTLTNGVTLLTRKRRGLVSTVTFSGP